jgi:hypothetical protein
VDRRTRNLFAFVLTAVIAAGLYGSTLMKAT